jgi:hypothetical protein
MGRVLIFGVPLVLLVAVGLSVFAMVGRGSESETGGPALNPATPSPESERSVAGIDEAQVSVTPTATATAAVPPTATAEPDRLDCQSIAGTAYRSQTERDWYLANCVPTPTPTASARASEGGIGVEATAPAKAATSVPFTPTASPTPTSIAREEEDEDKDDEGGYYGY